MSSSIRYIDDQDGNHVFPVTHERAVRDSDGVTLETKLGQKQATLISGTNIKTVKGTSILGPGNIDVQDGKSAYQLWLDQGNVGTEAEFVASLKGETGATGATGPQGPVGATPAISIGTVTTGEAGSQAAATMTGTTAAPVLNLTIPQGVQGNTGSSVDYPFELANNLTTDDATKALSAAQGKVLDGKIGQLEAKVGNSTEQITLEPISTYTSAVISQTDGTIGTASARSAIVNEYNLPNNTQGLKVSGRNGVSSGYCMLAYFDSNGVFLGYELPNTGTGHNVENYDATIPTGAKKIRVAGSDTDIIPGGQSPEAVVRVPTYGLSERVSAVENETINLQDEVERINSEFYVGIDARTTLTAEDSYTYAVIDTTTGEIGSSAYASAIVKDFLLPDGYSSVLVSGRRGVALGCSMIAYFNGETCLGTELPNTGTGTDVVNYSPTIPDGTTMIRVAGSTTFQDAVVSVALGVKKTGIQKELNILVFGNSYSYDSFAYIPYIVRRNLPYVKLNLAILYQGHCSLQEHLDNVQNDTAYPQFAHYFEDEVKWKVQENAVSAEDALTMKQWDIIIFQQNSANSRTYSTYSYLGDLIDEIYAIIDYPVKIGWNMTHAWADGYSSLSDSSAEMYADIVACVEQLVKDYPIEFVLPYGTAIQNARGTSLDSLGTFGHLTYDGTHLNDGIPCLVASYAVFLELVKQSGNDYRSIIGEQTRPDATWTTEQAIPQSDGSPVGVNDANCLIAQKCAVMAEKYPFEVSTIR